MRAKLSLLATAFAIVLAIAGCGRDDETLLAYVPADTPYVMANLEPFPTELLQSWNAKLAPVVQMYDQMLDATVAQMAASDQAGTPAARVTRATLQELKGNLNLEGIKRLGLAIDGHFAFYGIGLVPVMRWELSDENAFRGFIGRIEKRLGEPLPETRLGEASYWRIGPAGEKLTGVLAITDADMVLTLAPNTASEATLRQLIGVDRPADALDVDRIEDVNDAGGYTAHGSGYVDVVAVAKRMLDDRSGIEAEFLAALGVEEKPVEPACREEIVGIAGNFPRATFGYTVLEPLHMRQTFVLELEPGIAKDFAGFAAPVPGLGRNEAGVLVDFGMSLDVAKVAAFATRQAQAVKAAPYRCTQLAELNAGLAKLDEQLSNPMVFAVSPVFNGFHAAVTKFDRKDAGAIPEIAGKLTISSPNPPSLLALARSTMPQLASMNLVAGGEPVMLPAGVGPEGAPPTYVAVTTTAIGFAVGAGEERTLKEFLAAAPGSPPPLLTASYSGAFLSTLMAMPELAEDAPDTAEAAALRANLEAMRELYGTLFDRLGFSLTATERGLELHQEMRMK